MSKLYRFRLNVRKAEFKEGFVFVVYGPDSTLCTKLIETTFEDGLIQLKDLSKLMPGPHVASLGMAGADRKPCGFDKTNKRVEKP